MVVFFLVFSLLLLLNLWVCNFNYIEALLGTACQAIIIGSVLMLLDWTLESAIKKEASQASAAITASAPGKAE